MNTKLMFSSETPEWETPQDLFDELDREFHFTLDVCASASNHKCAKYYSMLEDGLLQEWKGICWMNPPYGDPENVCKDNCKKKVCAERGYHTQKYIPGIADWMNKAAEVGSSGRATVVCLIPARTDTRWWHDNIWDAEKHKPYVWVKSIRFLKGRLKFGGSDNSAPFPSAIVVLGL